MNSNGKDDSKSATRKIVTDALKNDIAGVDDWKRSKLSFFTGFGIFMKTAKMIGGGVSESGSRTKYLWDSLFLKEDRYVPALDDNPEQYSDARTRFEAAVQAQNITSQKLEKILINTYNSSLLYGLLFILSITISVFLSLYSLISDIFGVLYAASPVLVLGSLAFKSSYTNWCVRHRLATGPGAFITSLDWRPKKRYARPPV